MPALSTYLKNKLFNHVLRNTPYVTPPTVYAALFKTDPTEAGTGQEVNAPSYARMAIAFNAPANGVGANTAAIEFPIADHVWGTVTHVALYDALTGGNMLIFSKLEEDKQIGISDQFFIRVGKWTASFQ